MTIKEARKLWTDALRSGKYKQGKGCLSAGDKYCCLGVACEVYNKHNEPLTVKITEYDNRAYDGYTNWAPMKIQQWLGIDTTGSLKKITNGVTSLTDLNDSGISFERIASIIEKDILV